MDVESYFLGLNLKVRKLRLTVFEDGGKSMVMPVIDSVFNFKGMTMCSAHSVMGPEFTNSGMPIFSVFRVKSQSGKQQRVF